MSTHVSLTGLFALIATSTLAAAEPLPEPRAALDRYYAARLRRPFIRLPNDPPPKAEPPPWAEPLTRLAAGEPDARRAAAAYLRSLLALAVEDETSGHAPARNTPYWGGGAEVPAGDLREAVAEDLVKGTPPAESLPVVRWYLEHEPMDRTVAAVAAGLGKVDGGDADALRVELATTPHPNAAVLTAALRQVAARKQRLPAAALAALCQHHRAGVREAARALNAQQGGPEPAAFDPAAAVRREPVAGVVAQVQRLMPDLPKADAAFVTVTVRHLDGKQVERGKDEHDGWVVRQDNGGVVIYTPYGRVQTFRDKEPAKVWQSEATDTGSRSWRVDVVTAVTVAAAAPAALVKTVVESRAKGDAGTQLSERDGLTGQFRGSGATLFEATLGAWLHRAGRDADAAQILLPALESLYRDEHLVFVVRDQVGELAGQKMLVAFVGDRDYAAALKHAKVIDELYPDTRFHHYAKRLAEELPRRADDFTAFKLPTPAEWAALKPTLTREQQIDYLCRRMRLLNCFQWGQPGGYDIGATQHAEPCGLSENAAWGGNRGKTEVINPLTELTGYQGWGAADGPKAKGLDLTVADVPRLSKHLRDDWLMPTVSFWRDFAPNRDLSTTRPLVASVIDEIAHKDVCRLRNRDGSPPEDIGKVIERVDAWAKANAGKTPAQLAWAAVEEEVAAGGEWHQIEGRVEVLLKAKDGRAFALMQMQFERGDAGTRARILNLFRKYDAGRGRELAAACLADGDAGLRLSAALVVSAAGDTATARPVLGAAVANGDGWAVAADALLTDGSPEARKELTRLTGNHRLAESGYGDRPKLLARCAAAGLTEPYAFYLKLLETAGNRLVLRDQEGKEREETHSRPVAEVFAAEVVGEFAPDDAAVKEIVKSFPAAKDQVRPLREWLRTRLAGKG